MTVGTERDLSAVAAELERFTQLFAQAPTFMALLDGPDHVITHTNPGYDRLVGHRQLVGKTVAEALPDAAAQGYLKLLDDVFSSNTPYVGQGVKYAVQSQPGGPVDERYVDFVYQPIMGPDGKVDGIFVEGVDVTERTIAARRREALVRLNDEIRDIDSAAEISFAAARILGETLGVSRAGYGTIDRIEETIAIERDWNAEGIVSLAGSLRFRDYGSYIENLKRGETVAVADAYQDPRTAAGADALKGISAQAFVNMPVTEQGDFVAILYLNHADARAWLDEELAFVREVADRTRSAAERRRAEQELRDLARSLERQVEDRTRERDRVWRNSQDIIAVLDRAGVIQNITPIASRALGWTTEELIGRSMLSLVHPDDETLTRKGFERALAAEASTFENRLRRKTGEFRVIAWRASVEDEAIYAYGRDVTIEREREDALHAAEDQLRQSQKMEAVGQLTGGLAHDFNNLLAGISGSLDMMQTRIAQGRVSEIERYLVAAQGAAKRAAALTHRLLAFSRRQTLSPKPTDVNRLATDMEELIRRTVGPAISVETVVKGGLWSTLVDPNQLENALLNLCINARDAMPDGGKITIETANRWLDDRAARERDMPPGQYVSMCVSDTGCGMSAEVIEKAFDPFFTTKPIGVGTGLGLSMIYGFARQSGGQVRIYSEVGDGTMVCVYLPKHNVEQDPVTELPQDKPGQAQAGETVLVIDDEPLVRMLIVDVLEDLGYVALEAADGPQGLKIIRSDVRIDLLITDVGLPNGMNGRQVADAAREVRPGLKVLFVTGYAENAVLSHGHLDPGMQVVTKPFDMNALGNKIQILIAE